MVSESSNVYSLDYVFLAGPFFGLPNSLRSFLQSSGSTRSKNKKTCTLCSISKNAVTYLVFVRDILLAYRNYALDVGIVVR